MAVDDLPRDSGASAVSLLIEDTTFRRVSFRKLRALQLEVVVAGRSAAAQATIFERADFTGASVTVVFDTDSKETSATAIDLLFKRARLCDTTVSVENRSTVVNRDCAS